MIHTKPKTGHVDMRGPSTRMQRIQGALVVTGLIAGLGVAEGLVQRGERVYRAPEGVETVPGEYIVKFRAPRSRRDRGQLMQIQTLERSGMSIEEALVPEEGIFLVRRDSSADDMQVQSLESNDDIEFIEPNYVWRIAAGGSRPRPRPTPSPTPSPTPRPTPQPTQNPDGQGLFPNDSSFNMLWGLHNTGRLTESVEDADIDAPQAWRLATGSHDVIVGVVDSGIDVTHPDLRANIWSKTVDGKTVYGYDAVDNDFDPNDQSGHGTHVAGTIGAVGGNGVGVAGVNWRVKLMGLRFLNKLGSGSTAGAIKAIDWGVQNGAHILNNSWGSGPFSAALRDAIVRAHEKGVLFVAAAGNESSDNDRSPAYPASYDVDNVISVAASTKAEKLADFSNWGRNSVHLAAPGEGIYSTTLGGKYESLSGTSMASPHVAGAAALALAYNPRLTAAQIKAALLRTADRKTAYQGKTITGGRLNLHGLLVDVAP